MIMDTTKLTHNILAVAALLFGIFWGYHIVECLRRKDFRIADKIFWFILLLVPVLGLIMYRGIGNEFYKKRAGGAAPAAQQQGAASRPPVRRPRGGVKIELPPNNRPVEKK